MKIYSFSQQGKRSNNEDYSDHNERLWMVCDGVGGHVSGERASKFVVETMLDYFQQDIPELNKNRIEEYVVQVQKELNAILEKEPELEKMGTTFTGIFKTDAYWYAAHLGDSRIYLYRPKEKMLWHTWDHSLVGELMKNKEITLEDGRHHPLSNRIQKAMIANFDGNTNIPDIVKIDNLQSGDLFMLCSDGVIEAWSDLELVNLFSDEQLSFEEKCKKIQEQCDQLSNDNNTALLLEVEEADAFTYGNGQNEELKWTSFDEIQQDFQEYLDKQNEDEDDNNAPELEAVEVEEDNEITSQEDIPIIESTVLVPTNTPKDSGRKRLILIIIAATLLILGAIAGVLLERSLNNKKTKYEKVNVTTTKETKKSNSKKGKIQNSQETFSKIKVLLNSRNDTKEVKEENTSIGTQMNDQKRQGDNQRKNTEETDDKKKSKEPKKSAPTQEEKTHTEQ